jgi:hypothetical protein
MTTASYPVSTRFDTFVLDLSTRVKATSDMVRKRVTHMTQSELVTLETKVAARLEKLAPNGAFFVDNVQLTSAQVVGLFHQHLAALALSRELLTQWRAAVRAARKLRPNAQAALVAVRNYLVLTFGATGTELAALGFAAATQRKVSAARTKATAGAKSAATRKANHPPRKR